MSGSGFRSLVSIVAIFRPVLICAYGDSRLYLHQCKESQGFDAQIALEHRSHLWACSHCPPVMFLQTFADLDHCPSVTPGTGPNVRHAQEAGRLDRILSGHIKSKFCPTTGIRYGRDVKHTRSDDSVDANLSCMRYVKAGPTRVHRRRRL